MSSAVIVDIVRTASGRGTPGGALSGVHPADLLATTIGALVERSGLDAREGFGSFLEKRPVAFPDRVSADLPDVLGGFLPEPRFAPTTIRVNR